MTSGPGSALVGYLAGFARKFLLGKHQFMSSVLSLHCDNRVTTMGRGWAVSVVLRRSLSYLK